MNPQVFADHGGLQTPYKHEMPDKRQMLTVIGMWRSTEAMFQLFNSIYWDYCDKLLLLVRGTGENLPPQPHPKIQLIGVGDTVNIKELLDVLINDKIIKSDY